MLAIFVMIALLSQHSPHCFSFASAFFFLKTFSLLQNPFLAGGGASWATTGSGASGGTGLSSSGATLAIGAMTGAGGAATGALFSAGATRLACWTTATPGRGGV